MSPSRMQPSEPSAALRLELLDEAATAALADRLAPCLGPGMVVHLSGDLGVGKTTFVRALLRRLGYTGRVKSPTFTLLEPYNLPSFAVYHFDFYRFTDPEEWRDAGFDEYFGAQGACLVEWPELAGPLLPPADLSIRLSFPPGADGVAHGDGSRDGEGDGDHAGDPVSTVRRIAELSAPSEAGRRCLTAAAADC
jgi:tRNA threonylcarbamoyladenosine biosynthesis protein TsaE